jgi:hypothetical protein
MEVLQKCQNVNVQGSEMPPQGKVQVHVFDCFKVFPHYTDGALLQANID